MIELTGQTFGRLTVLSFTGRTDKFHRALWLCQCSCSKQIVVTSHNLRTGQTKSCGCLHIETLHKHRLARKTHGFTGTRIHRIWKAMLQRCFNPNMFHFHRYGGRGITVCERWRKFENFLADVGEPPSPEHSLDRYPNPNGNYEAGNVRWATPKQQRDNTSQKRLLSAHGKTQTLKQWAHELGMSMSGLHARLATGWPVERALTVPPRGGSAL